ncbi:MAG: hypothetical protein AOY29_05145 [Alcanivorax borkumensis]|jgi:hypothetical protein|nr:MULTISPECIES: hypothetical protein [Alcanivorax]EUC68168.1 hypothetical protein Y017_06255 [Alcanivorax sp. 97CO-5]OJH06832.1 MAG: hypothetical protein AOY29_05145 [Alcanivorax borkumensis]PKG00537.1 hypothetical protein Y019_13530 [Alcanivorax sp. 97CO-6]BAP13290.1 hypothetical protein AS19_04390 [Alcanivorax sp. NBRC 101098]
MESTLDHRWLMQYNIVNLVNQCRRLIRAEFDENLSLTDPELRIKLAHFAGYTRSQGLQRLYGEVRLALLNLEGADPRPQRSAHPSARLYRGQKVISPRSGNSAAKTHPRPEQKAIMYRGRTTAQN